MYASEAFFRRLLADTCLRIFNSTSQHQVSSPEVSSNTMPRSTSCFLLRPEGAPSYNTEKGHQTSAALIQARYPMVHTSYHRHCIISLLIKQLDFENNVSTLISRNSPWENSKTETLNKNRAEKDWPYIRCSLYACAWILRWDMHAFRKFLKLLYYACKLVLVFAL